MGSCCAAGQREGQRFLDLCPPGVGPPDPSPCLPSSRRLSSQVEIPGLKEPVGRMSEAQALPISLCVSPAPGKRSASRADREVMSVPFSSRKTPYPPAPLCTEQPGGTVSVCVFSPCSPRACCVLGSGLGLRNPTVNEADPGSAPRSLWLREG